jgi:hypothetical protein
MLALVAVFLWTAAAKSENSIAANATRIAEISEDFEDTAWAMSGEVSSNGLWSGSQSGRGLPAVLEVAPVKSADGKAQSRALRVQCRDVSSNPRQDDLVTVPYLQTPLARNLSAADRPLYMARFWLPDIPAWPEGYEFLGMRLAARDPKLVSPTNPSGEYYPSIWLVRNGRSVDVVARVGDGIQPDKKAGTLHPGKSAWITLAIEWDKDGRTFYYATDKPRPISKTDQVWKDATSGRVMNETVCHFLSFGHPADGKPTPDVFVDSYEVFTRPAEPKKP